MNKLKTFVVFFFLPIIFFSEPLSAAGYASVSDGINISASPVTLGQNFSISFTLKEVRGESKTFEDIAIAILDPNGNLAFDFKKYGSVTIGAYGSWSDTATNYIYPERSVGTYKAVIRGKYAGSWFDFDTTGSGMTPKSFSVIAPGSNPSATGDIVGRDMAGTVGFLGHVGMWTGNKVIEVLKKDKVIQQNTLSDFQSRSTYWGARYGKGSNFYTMVSKGWDQRYYNPVYTITAKWQEGRYVNKCIQYSSNGTCLSYSKSIVNAKFRCDTFVNYMYWKGTDSYLIDVGSSITPGIVYNAMPSNR